MSRIYTEFEVEAPTEQIEVAKARIATLEKAPNIVVIPKTCKVCECSCGNAADHKEKCAIRMCKKDKCTLLIRVTYCPCKSCEIVNCFCKGDECDCGCGMCSCACPDYLRFLERMREEAQEYADYKRWGEWS